MTHGVVPSAWYSGMTHGVGRSGDLTAEQPKAAGSSILSKLTHLMAAQALKLAGLSNVTSVVVLPVATGSVVVLPVATGMSITLCLMGLSLSRPGRRKVVWPRVDQKTCLKAMLALGLEPIIIKNHTEGDEIISKKHMEGEEVVVADHDQIEAAIAEHGAENILAVVITTSCFAPRAPDDVVLVLTPETHNLHPTP
ncbi:soluble liver antigen/liver pancreas antigen [Baffinella frigidus]|nr:soluble liver antigen/liver pancreas antigen [Cryptophyta sp. CCMP2293]